MVDITQINQVSQSVTLRSNLSASKLKEDNPNWSKLMVDDYLAIAIGSNEIATQVNLNTFNIAVNAENIAANTEQIASNFQYLHGDPEPSPEYDESAGYAQFDKVTFNGNEYSAINAIGAPAGAFNPSLWRQVSTQLNHDFINETRQDSLDAFTFAAYGGLFLASPPAAFPDIDGTWQTLTAFDTETFTTPRNITQNIVNDSLAVDEIGVYEFSIILAFTHNESNAGRTTSVRLYNLTDAAPLGIVIPAFIARNQPGTNFSYSFLVEFSDPNLVGKELVVQIGGGDTLTAVSFISARLSIKSVGEFRGEL